MTAPFLGCRLGCRRPNSARPSAVGGRRRTEHERQGAVAGDGPGGPIAHGHDHRDRGRGQRAAEEVAPPTVTASSMSAGWLAVPAFRRACPGSDRVSDGVRVKVSLAEWRREIPMTTRGLGICQMAGGAGSGRRAGRGARVRRRNPVVSSPAPQNPGCWSAGWPVASSPREEGLVRVTAAGPRRPGCRDSACPPRPRRRRRDRWPVGRR